METLGEACVIDSILAFLRITLIRLVLKLRFFEEILAENCYNHHRLYKFVYNSFCASLRAFPRFGNRGQVKGLRILIFALYSS